jgi:hypothetical protein
MRAGDLLGSGTISGGAHGCSPARLCHRDGTARSAPPASHARRRLTRRGMCGSHGGPAFLRIHAGAVPTTGLISQPPPPLPLLVIARLC